MKFRRRVALHAQVQQLSEIDLNRVAGGFRIEGQSLNVEDRRSQDSINGYLARDATGIPDGMPHVG